MKRIRTTTLIALACGIGLSLTGCFYVAAAGAAGGTYAYVKGELQETMAAPLPKVIEATDAALKDLALTVTSRRTDGLLGEYALIMADGHKVTVRLENFGTNATRVGVRVGIVGDRGISARIMNAVRNHL